MVSISQAYSILSRAINHEGGLFDLCQKFLSIVRKEGQAGISLRIKHLQIVDFQENLSLEVSDAEEESINYQIWLSRTDKDHAGDALKVIRQFKNKPLITIVCPIYNPNPKDLHEAINSVLNQYYTNWELCLADDCSTNFDIETFLKKYQDKRIKFIKRPVNGNISATSNSAIGLSSGEYICFLDQDDLLSPDALFWITFAVNKQPELKFMYSDEDKLDEAGQRCDPNFKPDWNYHYLLACNYICHLAIYRRDLLTSLDCCQIGMEGAQDYDLVLRASENLKLNEIYHIPRILYHWRKHPDSTSQNPLAKPYALEAGERAIKEHLSRTNIRASVQTEFTRYEVSYDLPKTKPKVSIIIPTRNQVDLLKACISSVENLSDYRNFEIVIVDNQSDESQTLNYLEGIEKEGKYKVIRDTQSFNYARLMNEAVDSCTSELICFLNNDIEVISKNWLSEMVSVIIQKDVGIVGAKLLYSDDSIQHAGVILGVGGVAGHAHKYFPNGHPGYINRLQSRQEYSAVTGACLLTRKSTFESVGGMDAENLSIAFNDVDYCLKVNAIDLKVVWTPFSVLYHHESKSRGLEDTLSKQKRYTKEVNTMKDRWGSKLTEDPAYNPNLTLSYENFTIAPWSRNILISELLKSELVQSKPSQENQ
jgi:glycosyltransferase involved in cell wall biosynthesis